MFHMFSRMGIASEEMARFLEQYWHHLAQTYKEEIMARDVRFMEEGLRLAAQRMGDHIVDPFQLGFRETYTNGWE